MKKKFIKNLISAAAVLAVSATATVAAIPFAACSAEDGKDVVRSLAEKDKLISVDKNHSSDVISTASGEVKTESSGNVYYVTPDGSSSNDGSSFEQGLSLYQLLSGTSKIQLQPGDTVYLKPATYNMQTAMTIPAELHGSYNKYIRIVNAALEKDKSGYTGDEQLVTLDFSSQSFASTARGVQIEGDYFYWYGIDVCGAGDNGLYIGGNYNTIEYCEFYNNRDTGLQLGRSASELTTIEQWPSFNLIKNCTSHNNYDNETYGENADGFAAKLTVGYGNVFDGCIAYRNSDDGWDLYAKTDSGNIGCVIIYNCVAYENGYLEYTQAENNARLNFNPAYEEKFNPGDDVRYFRTRDGDGNGFKLGGSVMEGDVEMYNCLSFNNRMHGVTDNSNPGFLKVEGVTSYDNSAAVDEDPDSPTFGQIIAFKEKGENEKIERHGNIDVSRQIYSYNSVINTLSVNSAMATKAAADAYRGSVTDSILSNGASALNSNKIVGSIDADTKNPGGTTYTEQIGVLNASDVFVTLPIEMTLNGDDSASYTYNLTGLHDLYAFDDANGVYGKDGALSATRAHLKYRNEDGSINMGSILAKKDGVDESLLISGKTIGSSLNAENWASYKHFFQDDFTNGSADSEDRAKVERAAETLTINAYNNSVFQDFEVPLKFRGCNITWTSDDEDHVQVGTDVENSISGSQYITMLVYRPLEESVKVNITATITCGTATVTKDFELTVMPGQPSIGEIRVRTQSGEVISEGGSFVVDQFDVFREPEVLVENGLDYHGKLLDASQYTVETTYLYSADKTSPKIEIKGFTPSNAGVYTVTKEVTLKSNGTKSYMTYTMYVSSPASEVDFLGAASVAINRDGFMISGSLNNATGMIYAVSAPATAGITTENIKTADGVKAFTFRGDQISYQFENTNGEAYTIYYALSNLNGEITTQVYKTEVVVAEVSSTEDFMKVAGGETLGEENPATTIYRLTGDLDFNGVAWAAKTSGSFNGLLNGDNHTVKNVTIAAASPAADKLGLFTKVEGGTIENIKFENISINNNDKRQNGLIATSYGGYFHNIELKNVSVRGGERTGGLIGQVFESPYATEITAVSLINDDGTSVVSAGTAKRAGGLIGLIQTTSGPVSGCNVLIADCYVVSDISGMEQVGGMVGAFDNAKAGVEYYLQIDRCYFGGKVSSTHTTPRLGGMIGYQSGNVGIFDISRCISVGELWSQGFRVEVSLKSASPIVGGYSSTAANKVTHCIANMEEYETNYWVEYFNPNDFRRQGYESISELFGEDFSEHWEFVYENNPDHPNYLAAPYLTFKH